MEEKLKSLHIYEYFGEWYSIQEISDLYKKIKGMTISPQLVRYRLKSGMGIEGVLYPEKEQTKHLCPDGVKRSYREIASFLGITYNAWCGRLYLGHSIDNAFLMGGYVRIRDCEKEEKKECVKHFTEFELQFL